MNSTGRLGRIQLFAWLGLSNLGAAALAAGFIYLAPWSLPPHWQLVVGVALGVAAGLLLSLPLRSAAEVAALGLGQLARGEPLAALPQGWGHKWGPLGHLLELVDALGARERGLAGLREDLVRSTGQAAAQAERNRLARELHDSIKQQLYAINVNAAAALARWETDVSGARSAVEEVRRAAQAALAEMAALLQQLRPAPLAAAGLLDALREQCEALAHRTGGEVNVDLGEPGDASLYAAAVNEGRVPPGAEEAIFRIAQEALNNIARHARANKVSVQLRVEGRAMRLEISDDGKGFAMPDAGSGTYGLAGMRDRAGSIGAALELDSAPGAGTRLKLIVPLAEPAGKEQGEVDAKVTDLIRKAEKWHWLAMAATLLALTVGQRLALDVTEGGVYAATLVSFGLLILFTVGGRITWSQARSARLGATLVTGSDHPVAWRLRRETYNRQMWAALVAVLILPAAWTPAGSAQRPALGLLVGLATALIAAIQMALAYRATEGYWRRLAAGPLVTELAQAWSQRFTPLLVLGITVPGYLWLRSGGPPAELAWPPSREGLIDILATVYLCLLIVWAAVTYFQARSWRKRHGDTPGGSQPREHKR